MLSPAFINDEKLSALPGILPILILLMSLSACGGGGTGSSVSGEDQALQRAVPDLDVAVALYTDRRTPDGFYNEVVPNDAFYTTIHLKNTDLLPAASRRGVFSYDLSSDDFAQALDWSSVAASRMPVERQLVDTSNQTMYHEFSRVDPANPGIVQRQRVYKSSVFNRDNIDDTYRGMITLTGFDADDVREIIEYQWLFTMENNYGNVILDSTTTEAGDAYYHTMQQARLMPSSDCDTIEMFTTVYQVIKSDGSIWKSTQNGRVFRAQRNGGHPRLCA